MSPEVNGRLGMQLQMCLATAFNHQAKPYFATWQVFGQPWGGVRPRKWSWTEQGGKRHGHLCPTHISRVPYCSPLPFLPSS